MLHTLSAAPLTDFCVSVLIISVKLSPTLNCFIDANFCQNAVTWIVEPAQRDLLSEQQQNNPNVTDSTPSCKTYLHIHLVFVHLFILWQKKQINKQKKNCQRETVSNENSPNDGRDLKQGRIRTAYTAYVPVITLFQSHQFMLQPVSFPFPPRSRLSFWYLSRGGNKKKRCHITLQRWMMMRLIHPLSLLPFGSLSASCFSDATQSLSWLE